MTLKFEEQDLWLVSISEDESWCVQSTWMPTGGCRDVDGQLRCRLWVFGVHTSATQASDSVNFVWAVGCAGSLTVTAHYGELFRRAWAGFDMCG